MRLDVEEQAAVTGINVLTHMLTLDLLEAEECIEVCELIFIESRAISHAAGLFAVNYLFSSDFMDRARQKSVPAGTIIIHDTLEKIRRCHLGLSVGPL